MWVLTVAQNTSGEFMVVLPRLRGQDVAAEVQVESEMILTILLRSR